MLTGLATLVVLQYLSARTQRQLYDHMVDEERREFSEHPEIEKAEMRRYYLDEGFSAEEADSFINRLSADKNRWLKAHVTHVLEFIPSKHVNPARESLALGLSHLLGASLALLPYFVLSSLSTAAYSSIGLASISLYSAGSLKARATGGRWYTSGAEFVLLGMVALLAGYGVGFALRGFV
jgi:VIT1/CCC1 family predicted Fe2+/Mn2+ transporter